LRRWKQIETDQLNRHNLAMVEPGQIAVVAVSPGPGISRIFGSLGVAAIVEGGQTMNPSTEEILHAFENLPTDKIIILPNNRNIILTSEGSINHDGQASGCHPDQNGSAGPERHAAPEP
jgi:uncharacterized protein